MTKSFGWTPIKRSPVHYKLVALGAVLEQISGWQLAQHFGDAAQEAESARLGVGLADRSFALKWEIKGADTGAFLKLIENGPAPSPGYVNRTRSGYLCRVSLNHALWILERDSAAALMTSMGKKWESGCIHVTDRTSGYAGFLLCGPKARPVLSKLTSLDLREKSFPDQTCRCGPIAAIQAVLVRRDRSELPAYEIFFHREYAEYLWDAVMEAGRRFEIRPFGDTARQLLEP